MQRKNDTLVLFFQIQRKYMPKRKKTKKKTSSLISDPKKIHARKKVYYYEAIHSLQFSAVSILILES